MSHLIATFFYIGHLRHAPGTWGSLAALPVALIVILLLGPWGLLLAAFIVFVAGLWATTLETRGKTDHDPAEIVIDEVAGQWIALLPVAFGAAHVGVTVTALWPGWLFAFLLFRLFDIWKPGPVGWADRRHGPLGVMLDDVIAGVMAGIGVGLLAAIAHGLFAG